MTQKIIFDIENQFYRIYRLGIRSDLPPCDRQRDMLLRKVSFLSYWNSSMRFWCGNSDICATNKKSSINIRLAWSDFNNLRINTALHYTRSAYQTVRSPEEKKYSIYCELKIYLKKKSFTFSGKTYSYKHIFFFFTLTRFADMTNCGFSGGEQSRKEWCHCNSRQTEWSETKNDRRQT